MNDDLFNSIEAFLKEPSEYDGTSHLLSDAELERLIISFATARGDGGFTEEEVIVIVRWAERIRIEAIMLNFVLDGTCDIDWKEDEAAIKMTEFGEERFKAAKGKYGFN